MTSHAHRRNFVQSAVALLATVTLAQPALADGVPAPAAPKAPAPAPVAPKPPAPTPAQAAPKSPTPAPKPPDAAPSAFVGTYTDPNHPGGKTTIKPTSQSIGEYCLAEVIGGGGKDEPAQYTLPAVIMGERTIFIDFSSKGGPKNFVGFLNKDGDVDFLKDGNRWSRVSK